MKRGIKYAISRLAGPVLFAGANFLVAVALQILTSPTDFGRYAFAQVVITTAVGLSSGLFAVPLTVMLPANWQGRDAIGGSFFRANALYCLGVSLALMLLTAATDAVLIDALLVALLGALTLFRGFMRALELALHRHRGAIASDAVYSIACIVGLAGLVATSTVSFANVVILQAVCCLLSLIPLWGPLLQVWRASLTSNFSTFLGGARRHGRWAVAAALASNFTMNGHAYIVTLSLGPKAFAPLALATLLFRPTSVVLSGFAQFERAAMAETMARDASGDIAVNVRFARLVGCLSWTGNVAAIAILLFAFPGLISGRGYDMTVLYTAVFLMALVLLQRACMDPETLALEAAAELSFLARVALIGSVTVIAIVTLVVIFAPEHAAYALGGTLIAELLCAALAHRRYLQFRTARRSGAVTQSAAVATSTDQGVAA